MTAVIFSAAAAQNAALAVDQQAYERFRTWVSRQPLSTRGPGRFSEQQSNSALLKTYRVHLGEHGFSDADIDSQIEPLHQRTQQLDAEHWNQYFTAEHSAFNINPNAFLVEMVKGRRPGRALDVAMGRAVTRCGWRTRVGM
jgi:hypothetical protein